MNLRDYILQKGLTQEEYAQLIKVSRSHLSAVVSGNRACGAKLAYVIEDESESLVSGKDLITGKALGYKGKAKRAAHRYVKPEKQKAPVRKVLCLL